MRHQNTSRVMQAVPEIAELFQAHYDTIFRFVRSRVPSQADAEDLTAQTFLQACRACDSARSECEALGWLFHIARNVIHDHWRRFYRSVPTVELTDTVSASPSPPRALTSHIVAERRVEVVLSALPPRYRDVLELRFLQGASLQETADAMGVTVANAKILQHRAVRKAAQVFHGPPDYWELQELPVAS